MTPATIFDEAKRSGVGAPPTSERDLHKHHRLDGSELNSLNLVHTPRSARWFARLLILLFLGSPVALMFIPWQQSIYGTGRVIAFDPTERQQDVEAPIDGRVLKWHVMEGHRVKGPVFNAAGEIVKPGDPLVSIQDPDPELPRRLSLQRVAVQERITAARDRIASFTAQIKALEQSQRQALIAAENRLRMADERLKAAREAVVIARLRREIDATNFQMEKELVRDGLTSQLTFLAAQQRKDQALAEEKRSLNSKDAALVEVDAIRADMEKIRADAVASISSATASRQSAEAELATATRDMAQMETSIARQSAQEVTAPCDGTVYRILCNSARGGSLVKSGERLMIITPDIRSDAHRDVELFLDGNDAPQLTELWKRRLEADSNADIHVRIQFEGWPAIQVVGWPSIAWGTFSGKVVMVDPHDDGKGRFRIMVQPDPNAEPWPNEFSLRQGTRAQGWVLLDRVSLGYELWRRFNGFPPVVVDKDKDDGDKQKPGKVKVPK